jgi:hypothetical protein
MNGTIKCVIAFAAGAVTGVLGTAYHFMKRAEKACNKYEEKCNREYQELYRIAGLTKEYKSENQEKSQGEKSDEPSNLTRSGQRQRHDYTKHSKAEPEDVNTVIKRAEDKLAEEASPMEGDENGAKLRGPRRIKKEDYGNNRTLETRELFYYTGNGAVTNEDDEYILPDTLEAMIGDGLTKYGFDENSDPKAWVRNERMGYDFQITKIKASYTPSD